MSRPMMTLPPPSDDRPVSLTGGCTTTPAVLPSSISAARLSAVEERAIDLYRAEEQRATALQAQVHALQERIDTLSLTHQRTLAEMRALRQRLSQLTEQLAKAPVVAPASSQPHWGQGLPDGYR